MALTEKGKNAVLLAFKYFPTEEFSASMLSEACGEKIVAATLTGAANNGYLEKIEGTSPALYRCCDELAEMIKELCEENKGCTKVNLDKAKKEKNDEFYTRYEDIEDEVMKYRKQFKDKIIYLPCDDPVEKKSEFWSFFVNNFDAFGLKKLIATHYDENGKAYKIWIDGDTSGDGWVDDSDALQEDLEGNGDFHSEECTEILKECDIVCTNPPFSLFRDFVDWILSNNKQFLIIGNKNAITYKEIFPLIKENKVWLGYTIPNKFYLEDRTLTNQVNGLCRWFTNLSTTKRNEEIILTKTYNKIDYPKYENYDAIEVSKVVNIPKDYFGAMGVPITFIDKYNPDQFEIIKFRKGDDEKDLRFNGKEPYFRVLIKRKK